MNFVIENGILKAEDKIFDCEKFGGLGNVYFNQLKLQERNVAQVDADTDENITYGTLLQRSIRTAIVMKNKDIKKDDVVAVCSELHLNVSAPVIASYFLGAIPSCLDPNLMMSETTELIEQIKPKIIFVSKTSENNIANILDNLNLNAEIVVFGPSNVHTEFEIFLEKQENESEFKPVIIADPYKTAAIYFSSGSEGIPKAICLSHYYFICQSPLAPQTKQSNLDYDRMKFEEPKFKNGFRLLCYSPMCWITSGNFLLLLTLAGGCRIIARSFDLHKFWKILEKHEVNVAFLSPYQITEIINNGMPPNAKYDNLVKICAGGAPLSVRTTIALRNLLPDVDIFTSYGQTEVGVVANYEHHNIKHRQYCREKLGCSGLAVPGFWYKVVDPDTEKILGANEVGELRVKSKTVTNGYYGKSSKELFDEDGWFKTGDLVKYDEDGCFFVVDRVKELLKFRTYHIQTLALEQELMKHPAVKQAAIIGKPHEGDGDHPIGVVIVDKNCNVTPQEIRDFVDAKVLDKDKLRGGVVFVDSFPLTAAGKVSKRKLKKIILG